MSEPSSAQRFAPIALWRVASRLMITLFNLFGEPQELAFKHTLIRRDYKLICNWLRCVEALFRKLLVIEASHYAHCAAQTQPRTRAKRQRRLMTFYPERPEAWRVSFRTLVLDRRRPRRHGSVVRRTPALVRSCAAGGDAGGPRFHSAWPLAERFEALLRVHDNPASYAKRLARRLYANPQRIAAIPASRPNFSAASTPSRTPKSAACSKSGQRGSVQGRRRTTRREPAARAFDLCPHAPQPSAGAPCAALRRAISESHVSDG